MRSLPTIPSALLALALAATPALAQDDDDLSLGENPNTTPQVGQTYQKEEIGDWTLECVKTETGEDEPCQMTQLITEEDGNPIATAAFFRTPENSRAAAGANIVVPLETMLQAGLLMNVDGNEDKQYPFSLCTQMGCVARVGFTQEELDTLKAGRAANIGIRAYAAPNQVVSMEMSLTGFTDAFEQVTAISGRN